MSPRWKNLAWGFVFAATCLVAGQTRAQSAPDSGPESALAPEAATPHRAVTTIETQISLDKLRVLVKPLTKAELEVEAEAWFKLLRNKPRQTAAVSIGVKTTNQALDTTDQAATDELLESAEELVATYETQSQEVEREMAETAQENLGVDESNALSNDSKAAESTDSSATPSSESAPPEAATAESASEVKDDLLDKVALLQDERTDIKDRLEVVLDSWESKGGDVEECRTYAAIVSGVELDTTDWSTAWAGITGWVTSKQGGQRVGLNLVKFLLILVLTYFVAKFIAAMVNWLLERKVRLSQLAEKLISRTIKNVVMLVGFAIALTALEIDITPILAAIGALGLIVGLALQGTLSNFASGLMILVNRPFDIGTVVTAGGVTGVIQQMNLVSTTFRTFDNQTIYVPNNEIWNNTITNVTANETRRVDLEFGIGYGDDFEKAENLILDVVNSHDLVLEDPEPVVVTHALADSSINIVCRPWAKTGDWWQVKTDITREVKRRFDQMGISIPYPQHDVHVYSTDSQVKAAPE